MVQIRNYDSAAAGRRPRHGGYVEVAREHSAESPQTEQDNVPAGYGSWEEWMAERVASETGPKAPRYTSDRPNPSNSPKSGIERAVRAWQGVVAEANRLAVKVDEAWEAAGLPTQQETLWTPPTPPSQTDDGKAWVMRGCECCGTLTKFVEKKNEGEMVVMGCTMCEPQRLHLVSKEQTHRLLLPDNCNCSSERYCPVCDGGLGFCVVCKGGEQQLADHSCQQRLDGAGKDE